MPFDHFDLIAHCYDRAGEFQLTEPMLGMLSPRSNDILLDVGGGTGRVSRALRGMVKKAFVVDVSRGMLKSAASKGLTTVCSPAESLPFPSESIDRIFMLDAFHHVVDQSRTASELWRVLAPGGRILIIEPDIRKWQVKAIAIGEKLLLMRSRILSGEKVAALFPIPDARLNLQREGSNVYLSVEKADNP